MLFTIEGKVVATGRHSVSTKDELERCGGYEFIKKVSTFFSDPKLNEQFKKGDIINLGRFHQIIKHPQGYDVSHLLIDLVTYDILQLGAFINEDRECPFTENGAFVRKDVIEHWLTDPVHYYYDLYNTCDDPEFTYLKSNKLPSKEFWQVAREPCTIDISDVRGYPPAVRQRVKQMIKAGTDSNSEEKYQQ